MSLDRYNIASPEFKVAPFSISQASQEERVCTETKVSEKAQGYSINYHGNIKVAPIGNQFLINMYLAMDSRILSLMLSGPESIDTLLSCTLHKNPPDHTCLRSLIHTVFTSRLI